MREQLSPSHEDLGAELFEATRAIEHLAASGEQFTTSDVVDLVGHGDVTTSAVGCQLETAARLGRIAPADAGAWLGVA